MTQPPSNSVLILSLVHPDLLPSLYSVSEVLRERGAEVHLLTFSSPTGSPMPLGEGIHLYDCGRYAGNFSRRRAARGRFRSQLRAWLRDHQPRAILAACPFGYLEGLRVRGDGVPLVFLYYEMYDATLRELRRSPATAIRNWRALRLLEKAEVVCTPSSERAGWLVGRAALSRLPAVVLNSPSRALGRSTVDSAALWRRLPAHFRDRPLVVNTGGMSPSRAVVQMVASVEHWRSDAALVVTNDDDSAYAAQVRRIAEASPRRDDIVMLPLLPRAEMLALQRAAAVGLNLQPLDHNLDIMFPAPNKIAEYVHAGLLVVATRSTFTERLADRGVAILTDTLEPSGIARAIDLAVEEARTGEKRARVLSAARDWYCMDVQLRPVLRAIGYV